ncbi:MAG: hypothetical protein JW840_04820 [Candidatus Thermoplasmatota archaeon]|nr:hypothetical protein [Candidatus Thermoplasmatota archaeon]
MLPCGKNSTGVVGLTLSQLGVFLATGILLSVVLIFVFSNDWQRTAELRSLSSDFSHLLEDCNNMFFEQSVLFQFPGKSYVYLVHLSTEYLVLSSEGSWGTDLLVTERFVVQPWPRLNNQTWTTGEELHTYLNDTYGYRGTKDDRIPAENVTQFLRDLTATIPFFAFHPFEIQIRNPVVLEKVIVYDAQDTTHEFLLLYQVS